ncbi:MAG: hypothetical protein IMF06_09505 [Proteobacteria bacterium]|nr:hypothetical protein [Pseudomonadota bacterium]
MKIYSRIILFVLGCYFSAGLLAHGDASLDEDPCVLPLGKGRVHLSAYQPDTSGVEEYCDIIPSATGRTLVVIDIIDNALRDSGVGLRIYPQGEPENALADVSIRPTVTGVLAASLEFPGSGKYVVEISDSDEREGRILLKVDYLDWGRIMQTAFVNGLFLAIMLWLFYRVYKYGRDKYKAHMHA